MPSALSEFRDSTKPGAVFTAAWPSPLVINGNAGSSVLKSPPDLRVVRRVTSSAIYYAKGDGSEVRGDFPKAYLIEKMSGGAFVIYDPKMTTSGEMKEIPGERGRLNRVYFQGDVRAELERQAALFASRLNGPAWGVERMSAMPPPQDGYGPRHVLHLLSTTSEGAARELRLDSAHDGSPRAATCVEPFLGVPFEFPLSPNQLFQVLGAAIYGESGASILPDLPLAWREFIRKGKEVMAAPASTAANDAPLPSASSNRAKTA